MASVKHRPESKNRPWTVRWREGGRNRSRGFRLKGEAQAFLVEALAIEASERNGHYAAVAVLTNRTLGEHWSEWLASRADKAAATQARNESAYREWLKPALAGRRLGTITHHDLNKILSRITDAGRGASTRISVYQTLCMLLDDALGPDGHTCRQARPGTAKRKRQIRLVSHDELHALLDALPEDSRLLVDVLATMGLRPGEALALTPNDIPDGFLTVRASKTGQTRRLPIPERLHTPLATRAGLVGQADQLWPVPDYRTWRRRVFKPAAERAGLPELTPYDLRHTCASRLIAKGATPVDVASWMGHSVKMTLECYSHLYEGRLGELAEILNVAY